MGDESARRRSVRLPALGIMAALAHMHEPIRDPAPLKKRKPSGKDRSKAKAARKQRKNS
jgi:hypothetical protein